MELVLLICAFVVFLAERLAFALMLYMLLAFVFGIVEQPLRRFHRWALLRISGLRWVRDIVQFWTALRLVRRNLSVPR